MNPSLVWVEIPAGNFKRAVTFYEKLFNITMEVRQVFDAPMALFSIEQLGVKGSIVEIKDHKGGDSFRPIFYVNVLYVALDVTRHYGGEVIQEPMLLRQKNKDGQVIIGTNLIDHQVGYYAKIRDSEGNLLYLYSHS